MVRVLALATEWLPAHGGVSTFNRRLCRALAAEGAEVFCSLPAPPSGPELADAAACGVRLVTPPLLSGATHLELLARPPELPGGLAPDVVLGHGRVTGRPALTLVQDHYRTAARFHIVHTRADELEWFKTGRDDDPAERAEGRTREERDLLKRATRVIAVGPGLERTLLRDLPDGRRRLLRVDPGFDDPDRPGTPTLLPRPGPPRILVVGRLEDWQVKGVDIAARAVGHALGTGALSTDTTIELLLRGSRRGDGAELRARVRDWAGLLPLGSLDISIRNYSTDADWLREERGSASLVLMPSRAEAFGLVGVEAIVAGIPLLAAGHSGLGELLKDRHPEAARQVLLPLYDTPEQDTPTWSGAIARVLNDRQAAFADADALRRTAGATTTWADAARTILDAVEPLPAPPVHRPSGVAPSSFYRQSIMRIAAGGCEGRDDELAAMADFATADDGPGWWRWLAPAWAGKTTVMAQFALNPPRGVRVVAFFITARLAGQNDRAAFCQIVQRQLYAVLGEEEPPVTEQTRDTQLLHALERAAARCAANGERLVLVVDGLDEDRGATVQSIAALLHADLPHGARAIVAGRPHPPIPDDVPLGHPLRGTAINRVLSASPHAKAARADAEGDLDRLFHGSSLGRDLVGLVAAAGGGLSAADLAHLAADDTTTRLVERTLGTAGGRAFVTRPPTWRRPDTPDVYLLAHEEIHQAALALIPPAELAAHRDRLHVWAETHRDTWPDTTADYLLSGYPDLLRTTSDLDRIAALGCDRARHDRLWQVSGADHAALREIETAFDLLLAKTATTEDDLSTALRLAIHRDHLHRGSGNTQLLVAAWARLGHIDRAVAMALAQPDAWYKAHALIAVAEHLLPGADPDTARRLLDEAEGLARALPDPDSGRSVLSRTAVVLAKAGDYRRAVELAQALGVAHWQGDALRTIAVLIAEAGSCDLAADLVDRIDDPVWQIHTLVDLADVLVTDGRLTSASDLVTEALRRVRPLTHEFLKVQALHNLADVLRRCGQDRRAADLTDQATLCAHSVSDPSMRGPTLSLVAADLAAAGRHQQALDLAHTLEPGVDRADGLSGVAVEIAKAGLHQWAVDVARCIDLPITRDIALSEIAMALVACGSPASAVQLVATIPDSESQSETRADLAGALAEAGLHSEAVDLARTVAEPHYRVQALAAVSCVLSETGLTAQAFGLARQATDLERTLGGPSAAVTDLVEIAKALRSAGQRQRASVLLARAAERAQSLASPRSRDYAMARIDSAQGRSGRRATARLPRAPRQKVDREKALVLTAAVLARVRCFQRAVRIARSLDREADRHEALRRVGNALAAAHRHHEALDLARSVTCDYAKLEALTGIAWTAVSVGDHLAGASVAEQAVELSHAREMPSLRARSLTDLARIVAGAGLHQRAVEIARSIADPTERARALADLAQTLRSHGHVARRLLLEALTLAPWSESASVLGVIAPAVVTAETAWYPDQADSDATL